MENERQGTPVLLTDEHGNPAYYTPIYRDDGYLLRVESEDGKSSFTGAQLSIDNKNYINKFQTPVTPTPAPVPAPAPTPAPVYTPKPANQLGNYEEMAATIESLTRKAQEAQQESQQDPMVTPVMNNDTRPFVPRPGTNQPPPYLKPQVETLPNGKKIYTVEGGALGDMARTFFMAGQRQSLGNGGAVEVQPGRADTLFNRQTPSGRKEVPYQDLAPWQQAQVPAPAQAQEETPLARLQRTAGQLYPKQ